MGQKPQQIYEGEWTPWARRERWVCCDCHLTHVVEYRARDKQLQVMMKVNRRSTAAYRRANGVKVFTKKK